MFMRSSQPNRRLLVGSTFVIVIAGACTTAEASPSPAASCTYAKARAVVAAFKCLVEDANNELSGGTADPSRCSNKLAATFAKAESGGACPTTGDDAIAFAAAEAAEAETLDVLGAAAAT